MLEWVRLVDFKSHRDTTVELGRFTVLVGPNACGKTSVLDGLELLAAAARVPLIAAAGGSAEQVSQLIRQGAERFKLETEVAKQDFAVEVPLVAFRDPSRAVMQRRYAGRSTPFNIHSVLPLEGALLDALSVRVLRPSAAHMAAPSRTWSLPPTMASTGQGLASLLAHLKLSQEETFHAIVADFRRIIPRATGVRIDRDLANNQVQEVILVDFKDARGIRAEQVSSGTILVLGILTAVHADPKPRVLLLDDVEQGLHPRAQVELVTLLKRVMDERPELQIVATTHSPYFLDEIAPEDVRVMALDPDGVPRVARLSDHPDAQHALQALTTGEFFSAESEAWVLSLEPKHA
jgi:predicted ATPase